MLATLQPEMAAHWERSIYDYSMGIIRALIEMCDRAVLVWIDANCPLSYARERFAGAMKS